MRILMVAAEAAPFAASGALGTLLHALPRSLVRLGHDVDVVIPRYRGVTAGEPIGHVTVALGGQVDDAQVYGATEAGVRTVFIDHRRYFDRDYLYGAFGHDYADNPERFAFLCQHVHERQVAGTVGIDHISVQRVDDHLAGKHQYLWTRDKGALFNDEFLLLWVEKDVAFTAHRLLRQDTDGLRNGSRRR